MTFLHPAKAFLLAFSILSAGTFAGAAAECAGVDTELTPARAEEYSALVAQASSGEEAVQPSQVELMDFMESGSWSAVYASVPIADDGVLFFEAVGEEKQFRDVWGGWADPSDRPELIAWAEELGAPAELAACFAEVVIAE